MYGNYYRNNNNNTAHAYTAQIFYYFIFQVTMQNHAHQQLLPLPTLQQ